MSNVLKHTDLEEILKAKFVKQEKDESEYKYAIYLRKSTDEENKQTRSLDDQLAECLDYAKRNNLIIEDPDRDIFKESRSAKTSGNRPKFAELIEAMKDEKYDGILCWHPDRLSRNMKDAGEIIDLLDKRVIKTLKFAGFTFNNDYNGIMTLGITFVLSKQYSDALSVNVLRGNKGNLQEGNYVNTAKHGYIKDKEGKLRPDEHNNNFALIREAFEMRLEGKTFTQIASFLNEKGYSTYIVKKKKHVRFKMTKQKVQTMTRDPAYAGVFMYGDKIYNFNEVEGYNFYQMVTADEFARINSLEGASNAEWKKLLRRYRKGDKVKADLLRGKVICADCSEIMTSGITPKYKDGVIVRRYYYYRCENADFCERKSKNTRAKVILDYAKDYLSKQPFSNVESYTHHKQELAQVNKLKVEEATYEFNKAKIRKNKTNERLSEIKESLIGETDVKFRNMLKGDYTEAENLIKKLDKEMKAKKKEIELSKALPMTYEQFLELWQNMATTLENEKDMTKLDAILGKVFLNFFVHAKSVEKSTLCEPFEGLETTEVSLGGGEKTVPELCTMFVEECGVLGEWNHHLSTYFVDLPPQKDKCTGPVAITY